MQAVHPGELVGELVGADRVSVGQVDVGNAQTSSVRLNLRLEKTGVAVGLIAGERGAQGFQRVTGEDGDAVVGLLGDGRALVAEFAKGVRGKVGALQFLQQKHVGLALGEPRGDVGEARADGVYVPACDMDRRVSVVFRAVVFEFLSSLEKLLFSGSLCRKSDIRCGFCQSIR